MAISDFQIVMLPLLKLIGDRKEYAIRDVVEVLAIDFSLTEDEKSEFLPSGSSLTFNNRVAWPASYLKKYELLTRLKRGCILIT